MTQPETIVFTKNNCTQCVATTNHLDSLDAVYQTINIEDNPEYLAQLKALGARSAPVVLTPNEWWAGYKEDKIEEHFGKK